MQSVLRNEVLHFKQASSFFIREMTKAEHTLKNTPKICSNVAKVW